MVFTSQMKFATVALMGAISIIDQIEGRRGGGVGSAPTYEVTRAVCDGSAYVVPDIGRRL